MRLREDVRTALPKLKTGRYRTLYMDPPWNQAGGLGWAHKTKTGAASKYASIMKQADLLALADQVKRITADAAHLYMWTTNFYMPDALQLVEAYGFRHVTIITWDKKRDGLGAYYRSRTEHCLFAVTKKAAPPYKHKPNSKSPRATEQGRTLITSLRGEHSEKPAEVRGMIERVSYGPYLELFGRRVPRNWDAIGNELEEEQR
jgi:N6-adenosine-specific RNA methylase IME4